MGDLCLANLPVILVDDFLHLIEDRLRHVVHIDRWLIPRKEGDFSVNASKIILLSVAQKRQQLRVVWHPRRRKGTSEVSREYVRGRGETPRATLPGRDR